MKVTTLTLAAATATTVAAMQHKHAHQHLHAMKKRTETETSWVAGPTSYAFVLDGKPISIDEVCSGIADNNLKWGEGMSAPSGLCNPPAPSTTTPAATTTSAAPSAAGFYQQSSSSSPASSAAASSSSSGWNNWGSGSSGVNSDFPDGQLSCGTFPSQYGAVSLPYLGLGGWSGIQSVTFGGNAITNIVTGTSGSSCSEGDMCSYACPPGYQKSQWPSTQGATGQSVGGIQCQGGKLHLTNPGMSTKLCIPGMGNVQAQNTAGGVVAICRTDYPGTESETIPTELQPGSTQPLTNPNGATYYQWQSKSTSAQYYLNPIGVPASQACQWNSQGSNMGNFAPINFGVGYSGGKTWLSIFQNKPTTYTPYSGSVSITGDLSAKCTYSNGQFCGATGCNADGCTVAVNSGTATFVIGN